jgi:hypothetical protein
VVQQIDGSYLWVAVVGAAGEERRLRSQLADVEARRASLQQAASLRSQLLGDSGSGSAGGPSSLVDALALISQQLTGVVGLEEQQRWRQQQEAEEQAASLLEAAQQAAAGKQASSSSTSSSNGSMASTSSSSSGSSRSSTNSAAPGEQVTSTQDRADDGAAAAVVRPHLEGQSGGILVSAADRFTAAAGAGPMASSEDDPDEDEEWEEEGEEEEEAPFTTPELQATEAGIAALDTALQQLQVARDALMEALPALDAYLQEHEAGAAQAAALSSRLELLQKLLRAQRVKSSEELLELTERHRQRLAAWYEAEGEEGAGRGAAAQLGAGVGNIRV